MLDVSGNLEQLIFFRRFPIANRAIVEIVGIAIFCVLFRHIIAYDLLETYSVWLLGNKIVMEHPPKKDTGFEL